MANAHLVHHTILHKLSLVLLTCLLLRPNGEAINRAAERAALLSLEGHWGKLVAVYWNSIIYKDHCNWPGVLCTDGFVTRISLDGWSLDKPIPPTICSFKNLIYIDLSDNNIPGSFPTILFNCSSLQYLDLSYNALDGFLPPNIHLMLPRLSHLNLASNRLSGTIPFSICQLHELQYLFLHDNLFNGSYPAELGHLSALRALSLAYNRFSPGRIHPLFGNLTNLESLLMSNMNIIGEIPDTMSKLTQLRNLDLSFNKLNGTIPSWIWRLKNLEFLNLNNNSLSGGISGLVEAINLVEINVSTNLLTGQIPADICKLKNLTDLYLHDNQLSGSIPKSIWYIRNLEVLDLGKNNLSGEIPDPTDQIKGKHAPYTFSLDVSSNQLTGQIPTYFQIEFEATRFLSNPGLCSSDHFGNIPLCTRLHLKKHSKKPVIIFLVLGSIILVFAGLFGFMKIKAFLSKQSDTSPSPRWKLTPFQAIDYDIQDILCGLIDSNLVGSGGSGKVYKIWLDDPNREVIAVKEIRSGLRDRDLLEKQFHAEIEILGSIRHSNIVKLIGYISSSESKLLIYEYMEHGSLYDWLHQKNLTSTTRRLNWPTRISIAIDVARGLNYMHHDCSQPIAHRDVKSSNILLDPEFKAKIADFGLARVLVKAGEPESVSAVVGSFGYIAPEFGSSRKVNVKVDVYSFGVVLLELTTGRHANGGGGYENLAQWAWRQFQDEDLQLTDVIDVDIRDPAYLREVQLVFKLGLICTGTKPSSRPSMREVLQVLQR